MKFKNYLINFYLVAAVLFLASSARGEVLFNSTSNPIFGYESINQHIIFNMSFSTPDYPIELSELTFMWRRGAAENGLIHIYLLSDKNSSPGEVMEGLSEINSSELPIGEQFLAVPIKNKIVLNSKARYWIKIQVSDSPGALAYARQHGGYGVANEFYLNSFGLHKNIQTGPYLFKVDGKPLNL